jgi:hypothetical protein
VVIAGSLTSSTRTRIFSRFEAGRSVVQISDTFGEPPDNNFTTGPRKDVPARQKDKIPNTELRCRGPAR